MTKRICKKPTLAMKKNAARMMKQISKTPKQLVKDAAEALRRRIKHLHEKEKEERLNMVQNITPSDRRAFIFEDKDTSMGNDTPYQRSLRKTWERYTIEQLVDSYVASLAKGKPSLALTDPQQEQHVCQCIDKRTKPVTLYMMCGKILTIIARVVHISNLLYSLC